MDGRPVGKSDLHGAMEILAPLGRGGGVWAGSANRLEVAVGVVLRARVAEDVTDSQPVVVAGGQVVVVADVVLDNRVELCRELGLADSEDLTDSELIAHAYLHWGRGCVGHLLGQFAFAVVDRRQGGVLLVRDQVGQRPLHVFEDAGRLCFASTALAVTGFSGVPAEIDLDQVKEYLARLGPSDRSWIRGVRPVPPATAMWITRGEVASQVYWRLDPTPRRGGCFEDYVEELRELFDQAVRCRLRGLGGAGVMLSGGLDSTSVAATVATLTAPEPVRTYTSVPPPDWANHDPAPNWDADESHLVFALAQRYPTLRPTFIDARGRSVFGADDDLYALGATPVHNIMNVTWIRALRERAATDGVGRLYTGSIGNSAFSIDDPTWLVSLLRCGRFGQAAREAMAWSRARDLSMVRIVGHFGLLEGMPNPVRRVLLRLRNPSWLDRASRLSPLRQELLGEVDLAKAPYAGGMDRRGWARGLPRYGLAMVAYGAATRAANEARWGLRLIDPTGELRLVQACARQPAWARRHMGMSRALVRAATRDRLPDCIRLRHVRGRQLPDWFDRVTEAYTQFAGELAAASQHEISRTLMDVERLDSLVSSWPDARSACREETRGGYLMMLPTALAASHYLRWFENWAKTRPQHGVAGSPETARLEVH